MSSRTGKLPGKAGRRPWSAEIHLRFQVARQFYGWLVIATRTSRAARRVTTFEYKNKRSCPEGSEHRASGLRMAPEGLVTPSGPPRPALNSRGLAKHFRSRARLRRLLVRLWRPTLHRPRCGLRQGGFAHYVRLRHYRSSLFCYSKIIPSHSFAALTALIVRRENGYGDRPSPCMCQSPRAPEGCRARTRQRHLAAVRGADRAYCAPRKWLRRPTFALHVPVAARPRRV